MQIQVLHAWDMTPAEARQIQRQLAGQLQIKALPMEMQYVAGVDVSYKQDSDDVYAAIVVLRLPELAVVEECQARGKVTFPYVPGLFSFREAPIILHACQKLTVSPDVLMFDGQGIAHPLRMGIAAHVGLFLNCPTVGCAKNRLFGVYEADTLPLYAGNSIPLRDRDGALLGAVVRTKTNTRPVFVSPGMWADIPSAVHLVLACCRGYRLPEPTRLAHQFANRLRQADHQHGD
jgi:deoxyribonuclease V